ncbi:hypothetical protein DPEC_G00076990, partial [Dallia pectoralis]
MALNNMQLTLAFSFKTKRTQSYNVEQIADRDRGPEWDSPSTSTQPLDDVFGITKDSLLVSVRDSFTDLVNNLPGIQQEVYLDTQTLLRVIVGEVSNILNAIISVAIQTPCIETDPTNSAGQLDTASICSDQGEDDSDNVSCKSSEKSLTHSQTHLSGESTSSIVSLPTQPLDRLFFTEDFLPTQSLDRLFFTEDFLTDNSNSEITDSDSTEFENTFVSEMDSSNQSRSSSSPSLSENLVFGGHVFQKTGTDSSSFSSLKTKAVAYEMVQIISKDLESLIKKNRVSGQSASGHPSSGDDNINAVKSSPFNGMFTRIKDVFVRQQPGYRPRTLLLESDADLETLMKSYSKFFISQILKSIRYRMTKSKMLDLDAPAHRLLCFSIVSSLCDELDGLCRIGSSEDVGFGRAFSAPSSSSGRLSQCDNFWNSLPGTPTSNVWPDESEFPIIRRSIIDMCGSLADFKVSSGETADMKNKKSALSRRFKLFSKESMEANCGSTPSSLIQAPPAVSKQGIVYDQDNGKTEDLTSGKIAKKRSFFSNARNAVSSLF